MNDLVIGISARNEGATIANLADQLELGAAFLGESTRCELVLAYQQSTDGTLGNWESRRFRMRHRVLFCPEPQVGKGRNVKALVRHAQQTGAGLLLVDGDLHSYPPSNVALFVRAQRGHESGIVLPLWSRPNGQANSTNFLACPVLRAAFGARIRQPLAGQMFLSGRFLSTIDVASLPDAYGIDVALTLLALDRGVPITQVVAPLPNHQGGTNSLSIMTDVARTLLDRLASAPATPRFDVRWREGYWQELTSPPPSFRSLEPVVEQLAPPEMRHRWRELLQAPPDTVRDLWCERLAAAVRGARKGHPVAELVGHLAFPFFVHAEYRRRVDADVFEAEAYVEELGRCLALASS
jgi:hypothetical protein